MSRRARLLFGLAIAALGVVMALSPLVVADVLRRPAASAPEMINLRATWGGSVLGLGAFIAWLPALRPWKRFVLGLLMWSMAGIGLARALGFVVDGGPDRLQWIWLVAEVVIAVGCALALRRGPVAGASLLLLVGLGCASEARPQSVGNPGPQRDHFFGAICGVTPRDDDRCSVLRDPLDDRDVDGCPDALITFAPGAGVVDQQHELSEALAGEMKRIPRLSDVRIVASAPPGEGRALLDARIDQLLDALVARGIERGRFSREHRSLESGEGYVTFLPFACDGAPIER